MHLLGIAFILYLLKLSAGNGLKSITLQKKKRRMCILSLLAGKLSTVRPMLTRKQLLRKKKLT